MGFALDSLPPTTMNTSKEKQLKQQFRDYAEKHDAAKTEWNKLEDAIDLIPMESRTEQQRLMHKIAESKKQIAFHEMLVASYEYDLLFT